MTTAVLESADLVSDAVLKTGPEWCEHFSTKVMDPDGWRSDETDFETAITADDFAWRWAQSTSHGANLELMQLAHGPVIVPEATTPTVESPVDPVSVPDSEDLQVKFDRQARRLHEIEECNARFTLLNLRVSTCESEVKAAKGRLSEAQEERNQAGRELSQIIDDANAGQGKLFSPAELKAAKGSGVSVEINADDMPALTKAVAKIVPLDALLVRNIRETVGVDEFERAKNSEDPIGLSDKQLEKLEAAELATVNDLEKLMREDSFWHQKISGFGQKIIDRLISTLAAYRRVHPQVMEEMEDSAEETEGEPSTESGESA